MLRYPSILFRYHKISSRTFTILISSNATSFERDFLISNCGKDLCGNTSKICWRQNYVLLSPILAEIYSVQQLKKCGVVSFNMNYIFFSYKYIFYKIKKKVIKSGAMRLLIYRFQKGREMKTFEDHRCFNVQVWGAVEFWFVNGWKCRKIIKIRVRVYLTHSSNC